jgi:hypothetical protein
MGCWFSKKVSQEITIVNDIEKKYGNLRMIYPENDHHYELYKSYELLSNDEIREKQGSDGCLYKIEPIGSIYSYKCHLKINDIIRIRDKDDNTIYKFIITKIYD